MKALGCSGTELLIMAGLRVAYAMCHASANVLYLILDKRNC